MRKGMKQRIKELQEEMNKKCTKCGKVKQVSKFNFDRTHNIYRSHCKECIRKKYKEKIKEPPHKEWLQPNGLYKCPHCDKEYCKMGIGYHIWAHTTTAGKKHTAEKKNNPFRKGKPWNKGLTKYTDERVRINGEKVSITLKKMYLNGETNPQPPNDKKMLSRLAKENCLGGVKSRRSIYYEKKDGELICFQSTYEFKVAFELDENDVEWIRPKPFIWIDSMGESHRYYPDFYLPEYHVYLDPKNDYLIKVDREKIKKVSEQNDINLIVLNSTQLEWVEICAIIPPTKII